MSARGLTEQVDSKVVLSDVLKQGGEDGEQRHRGVVDVLRHAFHLRAGVSELPQLQVLEGLLQVLGGVLEEGPQPQPHQLGARLHHRPVQWRGTRMNEGVERRDVHHDGVVSIRFANTRFHAICD